jgi:hypothetical protein
MALKKIELDVFLGEQDRWVAAVKFMEAVDKFYDSETQLKSIFIINSLTAMEKFRMP